MPRIRQDNDARYALRASFVDENGVVITGDTIVIPSTATDPRISDQAIANWNTAFSWGDHASAGYLTTETDPTVPAHVKSITTTEKSNWNIAVSWGDHASAGYLTSYTETDPTVPSHVKSITTTEKSNWNIAVSWGDHASVGYLKRNTGAYSGTYNVPVDVGGTLYTTPTAGNVTIQGSTGNIYTPGSIDLDGNLVFGANNQSLRQNNPNNVELRVGATGAAGLTFYDSGGSWKAQLYGSGTDFGFLASNWGSWDLKKTNNGDLVLRVAGANQTAYHTGNLPTIPTNNNQLTNGAGYITSSGSITGSSGSCTGNAATASLASTVSVYGGQTSQGSWYDAVWHSGSTLYSTPSVEIYPAGGYLKASYFNTTHTTTTRSSETIFYSSTDDYIRKNTATGMRNSLNVPTRTGGNASGTWPISITGNAATATSATSATSASSATTASQVTINYSNNSNSTSQMLWGSGNSVYGTAGINCNPYTNTIYSGQIVCSDWLRTTGNTGWYSNTWGGGMNMEDATWVRVYNSKQLYVGNTSANAIATPGDVVAGYSDERLKDVEEVENDALTKIKGWDSIYYRDNEKARELGYSGSERKFGLVAQQVQETLPEVIKRAPADMDADGGSKTGEDYITVDYDRIVPMLVAGIKEQTALIDNLTAELESVKIQLQELRDGASS